MLIIIFIIICIVILILVLLVYYILRNGRTAESETALGRARAHPYLISLRLHGNHQGGGSIIGNEWVITAAHCVIGELSENLKIVAGSDQLDTGGRTYKVLEVRVHPEYNPLTVLNDTAVLKVEPIEFNENVNKIEDYKNDVAENEPLMLPGWGRRSPKDKVANDLQCLEFKLKNTEKCIEIYKNNVWLVGFTQICATTYHGEGACPGYSGGPLVIKDINGKHKLAAVCSWGNQCKYGPDVNTRVSAYIPWYNYICQNCL